MCGQYLCDLYHGWDLSLPFSQRHLRCSCPRPLALRFQVYEAIHYLPINSSIAANHITLPLDYLYPFSFLWLSKGLLLFQLFMFSDYCCFSISWPFLPIINLHNMPITYYCLPLLQLSWNSIIIFILFCLVIEAVECVSAFFFSVESTQSVISLFALCACVATMAKLCTA